MNTNHTVKSETALAAPSKGTGILAQVATDLGLTEEETIVVYGEALGMRSPNPKDKHVVGIVKRAAMWFGAWGMVPGIHVSAMPFNENSDNPTAYGLVDKFNYWKDCLEQYNCRHRTRLRVIFREATPEEIRAEYDKLDTPAGDRYTYDPRDPGMYAALINLDEIREMEALRAMGLEPVTWHFGTYRHKAARKQGTAKPEMLPRSERPEDVAHRRAMKKAIKGIIPPYKVGDDTALLHQLQIIDSERKISPMVGADAPTIGGGGGADDDMLYAMPRHRAAAPPEEKAAETEFWPEVEFWPGDEEVQPHFATKEQIAEIVRLANATAYVYASLHAQILDHYDVESLEDLTEEQAEGAIARLKDRPVVREAA